MEDFFFNDIWRMDWGLGNPNKTAILIAELMISVWALTYIKKWGFWVSILLFTILGCCLVHTFSRGGIIAFLFGVLPLAVLCPRPWPYRKAIAVVFSLLLIGTFTFYLNAHLRLGQGIKKEDRSITNRLILWQTTPAMMVDAPGGWGIGNSGKAFMRWYQSTQCNERYRTLVNSHLTWLVEFGWLFRFFYIFAWSTIFLICFPSKKNRWRAIPTGIWLLFGIGAIFSSVAESIWLWIIPVVTFLIVLFHRWRTVQWPRIALWLVPAGAACFLCFLILVLGNRGKTKIHCLENQVIVGNTEPSIWIVVDEQTLGTYGYAKSLRNYLNGTNYNKSVGFVQSLEFLPDNIATVVVSGFPKDLCKEKMIKLNSSASKMILLSPGYHPKEAGINIKTTKLDKVLFGEFSQSEFIFLWEATGKVQRIVGVGDFFQSWPEIIFGGNEANMF